MDIYDFMDLLTYLGLVIVVVVLGIAAIVLIASPFVWIGYQGEKDSCQKYSKAVGYQTKFVDNWPYYWSCQVKTPSGWIDYDKIQSINLSNGANE